MILRRVLGRFCQGLTDGDGQVPGFIKGMQLSIVVAPVLYINNGNTFSPPFDEFFSPKMQERLLAPFRVNLHEFKAVGITGRVESSLAAAVCLDLVQDKYSDPTIMLAEFSAAKEQRTSLFREGKCEAANRWMDAAIDIKKLFQSSSWPSLVHRGGESFISQLAPLYFLMRLNIAHIEITFGTELSKMIAEDSLRSAVQSLKKGFWMSEYRYVSSAQHFMDNGRVRHSSIESHYLSTSLAGPSTLCATVSDHT
jgi:hypothetical protein